MKRSNWFRRALAMLMAAMLVLSAGSALAAEEKVDGSKEATELDGRETTVTLKLPSAESHYKYDIVFVMDSSTSTVNSNIDFSTYANNLFTALAEKDAELRIGVIKCRGLAFDTTSLASGGAQSGLVEYSADTAAAITAGLNYTEADLKALSSGTNMHGALKMANDWLTADTEVEDDHKYVIMLTDGKTYMWNNEDDVPMTYYGQYMAKKVVYPTPAVGQQTIAYSKSAYKFQDNVNFFAATAEELNTLSMDEYFAKTGNFYTDDFAKLYASTHEDLTGVSK